MRWLLEPRSRPFCSDFIMGRKVSFPMRKTAQGPSSHSHGWWIERLRNLFKIKIPFLRLRYLFDPGVEMPKWTNQSTNPYRCECTAPCVPCQPPRTFTFLHCPLSLYLFGGVTRGLPATLEQVCAMPRSLSQGCDKSHYPRRGIKISLILVRSCAPHNND